MHAYYYEIPYIFHKNITPCVETSQALNGLVDHVTVTMYYCVGGCITTHSDYGIRIKHAYACLVSLLFLYYYWLVINITGKHD